MEAWVKRACTTAAFASMCLSAVVACSASGGGSGAPGRALPPSCGGQGPGVSECGPSAESCCASLPVPGGTFDRSYDGLTFTDPTAPATVSAFRLDTFEVTVGRFRAFVQATANGWVPPAGAGKHAALAGGGLNAGMEAGWESEWTPSLESTRAAWNAALDCGDPYATWTQSPGANESLPVNCVTWYEAYAFCIWDGGFLPSEAEWNEASAGGSEQRAYPWSVPPASTEADYTYASYDCMGQSCDPSDILPVGSDPKGAGKWGQLDLGGNILEWTLDWFETPYAVPCVDCAALGVGKNRVLRGGSFEDDEAEMLASARDSNTPPTRNESYGARCARAPESLAGN